MASLNRYNRETANDPERDEARLPPVKDVIYIGDEVVCEITWQSQSMDQGINGMTLEALYDLINERLWKYGQAGFGCSENSQQRTHIQIARNFQLMRENRMKRLRERRVDDGQKIGD